MCGICGMIGRPDLDAVRRMTAAMVHRGPDDESYYADARAALGFRRLSIIDVAGGRQPLSNEDGSIQVVFNGEIYNHQELRSGLEARGHVLRSGSDGEVLAHLYEEQGADLVEALNGIFAFALWDVRAGRVMLARDPHGVKPLYYAEQEGRLLFASELKALVASRCLSRDLDPEAIAQYPDLPGRPVATVDPQGRRRAAAGPDPRGDAGIDDPAPLLDAEIRGRQPDHVARGSLRQLVRARVEDAVKQQLIAERPLGVFLSGGVDSSALVALAAQQVSHRLKTFSVGFVGPDEAVMSEWPWAKKVSDRYDTDHHEFVLTEDMFREAMPPRCAPWTSRRRTVSTRTGCRMPRRSTSPSRCRAPAATSCSWATAATSRCSKVPISRARCRSCRRPTCGR